LRYRACEEVEKSSKCHHHHVVIVVVPVIIIAAIVVAFDVGALDTLDTLDTLVVLFLSEPSDARFWPRAGYWLASSPCSCCASGVTAARRLDNDWGQQVQFWCWCCICIVLLVGRPRRWFRWQQQQLWWWWWNWWASRRSAQCTCWGRRCAPTRRETQGGPSCAVLNPWALLSVERARVCDRGGAGRVLP
jgi:hypothetical protein